MSHYVLVAEMRRGDAFDMRQSGKRLVEPFRPSSRKIALRGIAGHHHPRIFAKAGEEHLHLCRRAVLRFIEDHEGARERPARMKARGATSITPELHQANAQLSHRFETAHRRVAADRDRSFP